MKKLHSLFVLSILALTMFVGCQMNTDDATTTVDAEATEYAITIDSPHGTVELDKQKAKAGETVILTITPDSGYVLDSLSVKMSDTEITTTIADDKTSATFTMPEDNVSVEASFKTATTTPTDDTGNGEAEDPVDDTLTDTTPTDDTSNEDGTPIVADFVDTDYDVYKDGNFLATVNGRILNAICKKEGFAKDKDYTIEDGNKVNVITGSRLYDWLTPQNLGGFDSDDEGGNDDVEGINGVYSVLARSSGDYYIYRSSSESGEEVVLPIMTLEGNKPTRPYLVKVSIEDSNGNDIKSTVGLKIEDNKIKFTMPSNTVKVYAIFENVSFTKDAGEDYSVSLNVSISKNNDLDFDVGICFTEKVFDNLEYIDGKYVFRVANKDDTLKSSWFFDMAWSYRCIIETTLDTEYELCAIVGEKVKLFDEKSRWINL